MTLNPWFLAARPKTLHASLVPIIVGASLAASEGKLQLLASIVCFLCALFIQIGTNFTNDLFDFLKGADTRERIGPQRAMNSGLVTKKQMSIAIILVFLLAFLLGLYLVHLGGLTILIIGIISIIAGIIYTAGPVPLAYHGMGDLFSFTFFGIVGTTGTYFVNSGHWSIESFLASLPVGSLITAILVVNNYRDIEQDSAAGKHTLVVIFGKRFARFEYLSFLIVAYLVPMIFYFSFHNRFTAYILLPLLSIPYAYKLMTLLYTLEGAQLNKLLEQTARFSALYGLLLSLGFLLCG